MGRENNALKMDCAICCLVFLFFSYFVGYFIRIVSGVERKLVQNSPVRQLSLSLCLCVELAKENHRNKISNAKKVAKCILNFFPASKFSRNENVHVLGICVALIA